MKDLLDKLESLTGKEWSYRLSYSRNGSFMWLRRYALDDIYGIAMTSRLSKKEMTAWLRRFISNIERLNKIKEENNGCSLDGCTK